MPLSEQGLELLKELEGISATPYRDSAGLLTIGCGHLLTRDELSSGKIYCGNEVIRWKSGPLSDTAIDLILREDLEWAEVAVEQNITVALSQSQYDALICFAFNIGVNAFAKSTLCRILNEGNYASVPTQLRRWCHVGGEVVRGLLVRREREIDRWEA
jgi:lysozyme